MKKLNWRSATALAAVAAFTLSACSTRSDEVTGKAGEDGVAMGPGVTESTISLGVLTDLTGPFSGLATSGLAGVNVAIDVANDTGGVCGRTIEAVVRDHGYNPQQGVTAYGEIGEDVLGLASVFGTPVVNALADRLAADKMLSGVGAVDVATAKMPGVMVPITTHDLETVNGLAWLLDEGVISKGDTIGVIAMEGGAGDNTVAGAEFMAKQHDLELVVQRFNPATDTDMTSQAVAMGKKDANLIVLTSSVAQTVSLASVLESRGDETPVMATHVSWEPSAAEGGAGKAVADRLYVPSPMAAFGSDTEAAKQLRERVAEVAPEEVGSTGVVIGYIMGTNFIALLEDACEAKELTREALLEAFEGFEAPDTGLSGTLTYKGDGKSPGTSIYMNRVSADTPGGLVPVTDEPFTTKDAEAFYAQQ